MGVSPLRPTDRYAHQPPDEGRHHPQRYWNIMPIIYLTTTGAKSGFPHSTPVLCIPDGDDLILVGSNWGNPKIPAGLIT